ncbi:beta-1,3-galactosyltransferase 7-like [Hibiscus syriacus]|uniref:Beta-1,3-galactosyltransferase 7-like n=1 Tax=Hibiscus syriacus TaxID=106335 RepID=A0A6A3BLF0_HIBSY|nr:beta-1,3-galactosyltransferase 7-like [Hibiscus syriacus]
MSSLQTLLVPSLTSAVSSRSNPRYSPLEALETCSSTAKLKQHHAQLTKLGLSSDNDAMGRLIKLCAIDKNGDLDYALHLFDILPQPDAFIYNTIIRGCLQHQQPAQCILFYLKMLQDSVLPNKFTFPCLIRACLVDGAVREGTQVHASVFKFGFADDGFCLNNLIHMYVNFRALEDARKVFDKMPGNRRDVVSWTTLISGYAQLGLVDAAFEIFELMPERNSVSWNAMIAAYVQSNRFHEAFGLFNRMRAEKVVLDKYVAASLTCKGISSWNCVIGGFAMHGKGEAAIAIFKEMEKEGVGPDNITFVNILSACSHSGLIEEGRYYFRIHGNIELGEEIGKRVIELEPDNSGRYVLLANMYADAGRWEDVANVRRMMNERGVKKVPGFSVIELQGGVNEFIAGGRDHPESKEIYAKVDEMLECIRAVGYVPSEGAVQELDEEEEKENPLDYHSEKLAIAFGLLKTKAGETFRITKNLRVCRDCHHATKLISKVFDREIIVRDRNRFHHFKDGVCSCKDYCVAGGWEFDCGLRSLLAFQLLLLNVKCVICYISCNWKFDLIGLSIGVVILGISLWLSFRKKTRTGSDLLLVRQAPYVPYVSEEIKEIRDDQATNGSINTLDAKFSDGDSEKVLFNADNGDESGQSGSFNHLEEDVKGSQLVEERGTGVVSTFRPSSHPLTAPSLLSGLPEFSHLGWGHWFTLRDLQLATNRFSKDNTVGDGGYGVVYRGDLINGTSAAVKKLLNNPGHADKDFRVEVEAIGHVRHKNLVRLLGYFIE